MEKKNIIEVYLGLVGIGLLIIECGSRYLDLVYGNVFVGYYMVIVAVVMYYLNNDRIFINRRIIGIGIGMFLIESSIFFYITDDRILVCVVLLYQIINLLSFLFLVFAIVDSDIKIIENKSIMLKRHYSTYFSVYNHNITILQEMMSIIDKMRAGDRMLNDSGLRLEERLEYYKRTIPRPDRLSNASVCVTGEVYKKVWADTDIISIVLWLEKKLKYPFYRLCIKECEGGLEILASYPFFYSSMICYNLEDICFFIKIYHRIRYRAQKISYMRCSDNELSFIIYDSRTS